MKRHWNYRHCFYCQKNLLNETQKTFYTKHTGGPQGQKLKLNLQSLINISGDLMRLPCVCVKNLGHGD